MKSIITVLTFLFLTQIGFSTTEDFAKLDNFFKILEENDRFLGSVAVARNGKIIYSKAIGYADIATKQANTKDTKFRIGSITKTFTATLVMKAVEMNKISLEETIDTYFPRIENAEKITVRHLLNHRSGIKTFTDRDYFSWHTQAILASDLLDKIISKGIEFEPNAKFSYSNSNYVLLTFLLEAIFEQSYPELLHQYITEPLNLTNTHYGKKIDPSQNEARSYRMKTDWTLQKEDDMSIPLGAGGIVSTPSDLCRFATALFGGQLITANSLKQMKPLDEATYGFALEDQKMGEHEGLGHGGDIDAFTATFAYFEDSNLSFALTCNGANYGKYNIANAVLNEVLGKPYELPNFDVVELDSTELDQYLGVYTSDQLPIDLTISKEGDQLFGQGEGQPNFKLAAKGDYVFTNDEIGLTITFMPEEGKMTFEQGGAQFEMTKKVEEASNENLDQYLGVYTSDELPIDLTISKEGDQLIGQGEGQPNFKLTAKGDHVFTNDEIGLTITFMPEEGKMSFEQGGASFEMKIKEQ
ncbi:MAG: serine hydrolase domain-containing protein [Bacteroidota bacterium]